MTERTRKVLLLTATILLIAACALYLSLPRLHGHSEASYRECNLRQLYRCWLYTALEGGTFRMTEDCVSKHCRPSFSHTTESELPSAHHHCRVTMRKVRNFILLPTVYLVVCVFLVRAASRKIAACLLVLAILFLCVHHKIPDVVYPKSYKFINDYVYLERAEEDIERRLALYHGRVMPGREVVTVKLTNSEELHCPVASLDDLLFELCTTTGDTKLPLGVYLPARPESHEFHRLLGYQQQPRERRDWLLKLLHEYKGDDIEDDLLLRLGGVYAQLGQFGDAFRILERLSEDDTAQKVDTHVVWAGHLEGQWVPIARRHGDYFRASPDRTRDHALLRIASWSRQIAEWDRCWEALEKLRHAYPRGDRVVEDSAHYSSLKREFSLRDDDDTVCFGGRPRTFGALMMPSDVPFHGRPHLDGLCMQLSLARKVPEFRQFEPWILVDLVKLYHPLISETKLAEFGERGIALARKEGDETAERMFRELCPGESEANGQ